MKKSLGLFLIGGGHALAEEQGNAPQARDAHDGVDHAADDRALAAADLGHQVKLEKSYQQPVDGADDGYDQ